MNENYVQFFTASILKWIPLLNSNKHKQVIVDSLAYLVSNKRCEVYAFIALVGVVTDKFANGCIAV